MKTKKENPREYVKNRVFKRFFLYFYADVFGSFLMQKAEERKSITDINKMESFLNRCKVDILILMEKRNIPSHWFKTLYVYIAKSEIELPLHEGISINVGDYQVNDVAIDEDKIKKSNATHVSIQITSKVSETQIAEFLKINAGLLSKIQNLLTLPKINYDRLDNFDQGFNIHLMSEFEKLSPEKITEILQNNSGTIVHLDTVKKIATRYKKYLKEK